MVDYRLAPVHKYLDPVDDAFRAYRWAQVNCEDLSIDFKRIAVGGDSRVCFLKGVFHTYKRKRSDRCFENGGMERYEKAE